MRLQEAIIAQRYTFGPRALNRPKIDDLEAFWIVAVTLMHAQKSLSLPPFGGFITQVRSEATKSFWVHKTTLTF